LTDKDYARDVLVRRIPQAGRPGADGSETGTGSAAEEDACPAFGFLRGIRERALAIEFRFVDGNSEGFAYSCLHSWRFNPSVGLLLKFTGDVVSLVLIRGSNLDATVGQSQINLTDRGIQRHRIIYIREMDEDEMQKAHGKGEPTIDQIEVVEFETSEEQREWLKTQAPALVRK
jgi:hypothetical protein